MITLIVAAALLQAAPEPGWRPVATNEQGTAFVDPASLRRDGDTFEIVEHVVFHQMRPNGMLTGNTRIWFDCAHRLVALRHVTSFGAGGAPLEDHPAEGPAAQPHAANDGSIYALIMEDYCPRPAPAS